MNIKESLGTKVGPLPMAAWGAIAIVGIILISSWRKGKTGQTGSSGSNGNSVDTVGYLDANGNPIVPIWSNLPITPPVVATPAPTPAPVKKPIAKPPVKKIPTPVTAPHKRPAPGVKSHVSAPATHVSTHSGSVTPIKSGGAHGKMPPAPLKVPTPVMRGNNPEGEHSGSRIKDLNGRGSKVKVTKSVQTGTANKIKAQKRMSA